MRLILGRIPLDWRELTADQLDIIDLQSVEDIKSCALGGLQGTALSLCFIHPRYSIKSGF